MDLARELQPGVAAQFDGFDVSLDQCPPREWLPENLKIHTWNIFDEPPVEFVGVFDIVHVRLVTVVVRGNDPRPVLKSLRKLLSKFVIHVIVGPLVLAGRSEGEKVIERLTVGNQNPEDTCSGMRLTVWIGWSNLSIRLWIRRRCRVCSRSCVEATSMFSPLLPFSCEQRGERKPLMAENE